MPYCRNCGDEIYSNSMYCSYCESDIVDRARDRVRSASYDEQRRMENDRYYAHDWLQVRIGWIIQLFDIISRIFTGGCYITTALVKHLGYDDNCKAMQTLRIFRDQYLCCSDDVVVRSDIQKYYPFGAAIVRWINGRYDSDQIWNYVAKYVFETIKLVDGGKNYEAYIFFKKHSLNLQKDILLERHKLKIS